MKPLQKSSKIKSVSLASEILTRGVEEVIVRDHLEEMLKSGKKLRVKFGIDPTAPDMHLGHTVPLRKLRAFQDLGHTAVLIIGDFTATVGDPSGRNEARTPLTEKDVRANMKKYLEQAAKVLDIKKLEVRYNSEWYKKAGIGFLYDLLSKMTVQRALERDDFQKRLKEGHDLSIIEMVYPLLQGYDSVAVRADLELGGTDQKFNLLTGRKIQRRFGEKEQDVMTMWLIEGTDGTQKMSKSLGNYIGMTEAPDSIFGKLMSIPDDLIVKYFIALTTVQTREIEEMKRAMRGNELSPRDVKLKLAETIVGMYQGVAAAKKERERFIAVFSHHEIPKEIPTVAIAAGQWNVIDLLVAIKFAPSKTEARRLIAQGAVEIGGSVLRSETGLVTVEKGMVIRVGKRKFARVK